MSIQNFGDLKEVSGHRATRHKIEKKKQSKIQKKRQKTTENRTKLNSASHTAHTINII